MRPWSSSLKKSKLIFFYKFKSCFLLKLIETAKKRLVIYGQLLPPKTVSSRHFSVLPPWLSTTNGLSFEKLIFYKSGTIINWCNILDAGLILIFFIRQCFVFYVTPTWQEDLSKLFFWAVKCICIDIKITTLYTRLSRIAARFKRHWICIKKCVILICRS